MKFHTIIITKNKIIAFSLCAAAAAAALSGAAFLRSHAVREVFNPDKPGYRDILEEELPVHKERSFIDIIKKITGFSSEEDIIAEMSPVLDTAGNASPQSEDTSEPPAEANETDEAAESNTEDPDVENSEESPTDTPETDIPTLPSMEDINRSRGIEIKNATNYTVDINDLCSQPLSFALDDSGPQVLIVHTHTTECYLGDENNSSSDRSADENKNVTAVGNIINDILENYGVKCLHDTTVHDYPSYQGAYTRALNTIKSRLDAYPSIKIVLDIHRDAFIYPDGSKLKVSTELNGVQTAKVMIVAGTDSMGLSDPNWRENLKLAAKIQNAAQIMYPGLMRPIDLRRERFNMHMTTGSLLLEVGSNGNTLDEAKEGAEDIAYAIAAVLKAYY